jgi:hypothetical protein
MATSSNLEVSKEFEATLDILSSIKAKGEVFISLAPPLYTSFEIDRVVLSKYLQEKGLGEVEFKTEADQIGLMLLNVLDNEAKNFPERFMQRFGKQPESAEEKKKERQILEEKLRHVKDRLYDEHLQKRYDLKKSSKAPSFSTIDWDIKVKHVDARLENLKPFPYATCRISFQKEFDGSPLSLFSGRAFDSAQINFSVDEITYLLRVFTTIKERLETVEKEVAR